MPNVMIRKNDEGNLTLYVAKRDQEDPIASIEHTADDCWGGEIVLTDGTAYYIEPMSKAPDLPLTVRAKRGGEG